MPLLGGGGDKEENLLGLYFIKCELLNSLLITNLSKAGYYIVSLLVSIEVEENTLITYFHIINQVSKKKNSFPVMICLCNN